MDPCSSKQCWSRVNCIPKDEVVGRQERGCEKSETESKKGREQVENQKGLRNILRKKTVEETQNDK